MKSATEPSACPRCGRSFHPEDGAPSRYNGFTPVCARCALLETIWALHFGKVPWIGLDLLDVPSKF